MLHLLGSLWGSLFLSDVGALAPGGGPVPPVRVEPRPVPAPATPEDLGAVDLPTDISEMETYVARDPGLEAASKRVDMSVLTTPAEGDPGIPDVTALLQAGKLDKAATVLRQALTTATPKQQYHLYFMLADIALAARDAKVLNEAYDQVLKVADPEEHDPIDQLRQKDLEMIAAAAPQPPATTPAPGPVVEGAHLVADAPGPMVEGQRDMPVSRHHDDGQPYVLENRVNEHKEDVEEHAGHVQQMAQLVQSGVTPDEIAQLHAQAARSYELAFQAHEKARGAYETLQFMASDYPDSTRVAKSLERSKKHLDAATSARQGGEDALKQIAEAATRQPAPVATPPVAAPPPEPVSPPPARKPQPAPHAAEQPASPPAEPVPTPVTPAQPPANPVPAATAPAIPKLTTGMPNAEETAWAYATLARYESKDPTLTKPEKLAYNDIATRLNKHGIPARQETDQPQGKETTAPAPQTATPAAAPQTSTRPPRHSAARFLQNRQPDPAPATAPAPQQPAPAPQVSTPAPQVTAPAPEAAPPAAPVGDAREATAEHEKQYDALAARADALKQQRWALSRREMAVTALGITRARAEELQRQRAALNQERAQLAVQAEAADQTFLQRLASLKLLQQASDAEKFISEKTRKIRTAIFGQ